MKLDQVEISNKKVKLFLIARLQNSIQLYHLQNKKTSLVPIRHTILEESYDPDALKRSRKKTKIADSILFDIKKLMMLADPAKKPFYKHLILLRMILMPKK